MLFKFLPPPSFGIFWFLFNNIAEGLDISRQVNNLKKATKLLSL